MREPYPENVDGDFYVESGCCTCCDVPMVEAPQLFKYSEATEYMHCCVSKQPTNDADLTNMLTVISCSEFRCVRYRGDDPEVLRRLKDAGNDDCCDAFDSTPCVDNPQNVCPWWRFW